ncbi:MAG: YbhB/YbcL family Raf kinase inhibitor-like protein [bacterium]|nr:YbhB/YbcL family Raf kinase inhibitor-like protein [bacterium]
MELMSPAFEQNQPIPMIYTCDGENVNPPLIISNVPQHAKSLVIFVDDPDVPAQLGSIYHHWIIYNIPPETTELKEHHAPPGVQGKNSAGHVGYAGPCPPDREHRYFFKLYALNEELGLAEGATREEVEKAMQGKVITQTKLVGKYERKNM